MLAQLGVLDASGLLIAGIESARKARGEAMPFERNDADLEEEREAKPAALPGVDDGSHFTFSEWRVVAMAPKLAVFRREPCAKKSSVLKRVDVTRIQFEIFCIS